MVAALPERLRDALGAARCLYGQAREARAREALELAGRTLAAAAAQPSDDRVTAAREALEAAALAAPWASPALLGAAKLLRGGTPSNRPPPPFFEQ